MKERFILPRILFTLQFLVPISAQTQEPELIVQTGHVRPVISVVFSPNGKVVASGDRDGVIKLWEVKTGKELRSMSSDCLFESLVFSPDGKILAGKSQTTITLCDATSGQLLKTLDGHTENVATIAFSPNSQILASGSIYLKNMDHPPQLKLWDVASGNEIRRLTGHKNGIYSVAFSPNGKILVSGSRNGAIKLWDLASGRELRSFTDDPEPPDSRGQTSVFFSSDGRTIVSGSEWDKSVTDTGSRLTSGKIRVWDVESGSEVHNITFSENGSSENDFTISPNGKILAVPSGGIRLVDLTTGQELAVLPGHQEMVNVVAFSPNGNMLASGSGDNRVLDYTVRLWDVKSGRELHILTGNNFNLSDLLVSPDGKSLASTDSSVVRMSTSKYHSNYSIKLWDLSKGHGTLTLSGHIRPIHTIEFSPDGRILASGGESSDTDGGGVIRLWDVASGTKISDLKGHEFSIYSCAFNSKGTILASGSFKTIKLWNVATRREILTLSGHTGDIGGVIFSPDDKILASRSRDSTIRLWDVKSGAEKLKISTGYRPSDIAFSPNGELLASGSRNCTIKIWDVKTGRLLHTFAGCEESNTSMSVAFSDDGKLVVGDDGTFSIYFWEIKSEKDLGTGDRSNFSTFQRALTMAPAMHRNSYVDPLIANDRFLAKRMDNGKINLISMKSGKELLTLTALGENDWAVTTPDGRFDTNKLEDPQGLHWIIPDAPFTPVSFEVFMRDYYEPNLLPRLLKCTEENSCEKEFKPVRDLKSLNRTQPKIRIKEIKSTDAPDTVEVLVEADNVWSEFQKDKDGRPLESGVFDVRLFRDGQMVGYSTDEASVSKTFRFYKDFDEELRIWRETHRVELKDGKRTFSFRVRLPKNLNAKEFKFTAYAFNDDRVKSENANQTYTLPKPLPTVMGKAYLVSIGVNASYNPRYNLRYAANDARKMQEIVGARLKAEVGSKYSEVVQIPLVSEAKAGKESDNARKDIIKGVFSLLAGRREEVPKDLLERIEKIARIPAIEPEDTLIVAFSGHGYADLNGIFYMLPADIPRDRATLTTESLKHTISSDEFSLWMRDITAQEMIMIIDACHSSAAVQGDGFKPAPMGSRGLGQLAYDKNMKILAATQADNVALELNKLEQGLLSYALVEEGVRNGLADTDRNKQMFPAEWLSFGEARVPHLYQELTEGKRSIIFDGHRRDTLDADFNLKDRLKVQSPHLFDFKRTVSSAALFNLP